MKKQHIHDYGGILLNITYTPHKVEGPTIHDVHVLDDNYRCVGPDLVPLLHDVLLLLPAQTPGVREATPFLSLVAEELT